MTTREICEYYGQHYENVKHMTNYLKRLKEAYRDDFDEWKILDCKQIDY